MSQADVRRAPQVASCVDEDDEEEVATPLANVAVKRKSYERRREGTNSDSGYSSKTGTTSSSKKDMADLKIDTSAMGREPQPYSFTQRPESHRRSSSRSRNVAADARPPPPKAYYVHKKGECYVCDTYGEHLPEAMRSMNAPVIPPSSSASRQADTRDVKREGPDASFGRRDFVGGTSRPLSMYASSPLPFIYQAAPSTTAMQYPASPMSPSGWITPHTPVFQFTPSVMSTAYMAGTSYFEQPRLQENRPAKMDRRSSVYGDAIVRQSNVETRPRDRPRTTSTEEHPRSSDKDDDQHRMPPPPRPSEMTLAHRPGIKKSATYVSTAPSPSREARLESSHPPSSYRPSNRKSASYSTSTQTTKVSSSATPVAQRRSTTTATTSERKVVDAEQYQEQRRSLTSNDLTAEALRNLKQRHPSSRSETSSHRSHHTKSSSSAGGKSKRSNSEIKATVNGMTVVIPTSLADQNVSISANKDGDVSISFGSQNDQDRDGSRTGLQKRLERAPSVTSRASRVSSRSISTREREQAAQHELERERQRELEQYDRERRQANTSRSRSRADVDRRTYDRDADTPNPWRE